MYLFLDCYKRGEYKMSIKNSSMPDDGDIKKWIADKTKKFDALMYNCDIFLVLVTAQSSATKAEQLKHIGRGFNGRIFKGRLVYLSAA